MLSQTTKGQGVLEINSQEERMTESTIQFLQRKVSARAYARFQRLSQEQQKMVVEALDKHRSCCSKIDVLVLREAILEIIDMAEKQERAYDSGSLVDMPLPSKNDTSIGVMNRTALGSARASRSNGIKAQMANYAGGALSFSRDKIIY